MLNLRFLRVFAVWEGVSQENLQSLYGKERIGVTQGIQVDFKKRRVKIPCQVVGGEIKAWVWPPELGKPSWFQLSLSVPHPQWLLVSNGSVKEPKWNQNLNKFLLLFRNGTVARQQGRYLLGDYLAVRQQDGRFFLIEEERVAVEIPPYIQNKEELKEFLRDKVPVDIFEHLCSIASLTGISNRLHNQDWVKKLDQVKKPVSSPSPHQEEIPPEIPPAVQKKPVQAQAEKRRGKPMPLRGGDDELSFNLKGLSLRDFQEES